MGRCTTFINGGSMKLDHIDYVAITVSDLARSMAWYQDVLGLPLHENPLLDPGRSFCRVGHSGLVFFLGVRGDNPCQSHT